MIAAVGAVRRSPGLQFAVVLISLGIIAGIVYEPQAINGGFISDAWANRANYVFAEAHGFFSKISEFASAPNIAPRPLQAVYIVLLNSVFGGHTGFWLTWQVASNVAMCATFYLLLRKLGFGWPDAAVVAGLILVFPAVTSIRFWLATIWGPASLTFVSLGFLLALEAFDARRGRNKLLLHSASLLFFVASLLLYEIALLVMLAGICVYLLRAPWREAVARWVVDVVVLGTIAITITHSSGGHLETETGILPHAKLIFTQAWTLATTIMLPLGSDSWYVSLLLLLIPGIALIVWWLRDRDDPMRDDLRRWLTTMAFGLGIVILGYAIYAPGIDYYYPLNPGIGDRVNLVPSFGWVLVLYSAAMLVSIMILRDVPRARRWISACATLGCVLIAVGWIRYNSDYSGYFTKASEEDTRVVAAVKDAVPDPKPGDTIWTFGQATQYVPGVPIFGNTWDMNASIQLAYDDGRIHSWVAFLGTEFDCEPRFMIPAGVYLSPGNAAARYNEPYGKIYFVDTNTGRVERIQDQRQCETAAQSFEPSPPVVLTSESE